MTQWPIIFPIIVSVLFPFLAFRLEQSPRVPQFFSAVVMCYTIGIILGNLVPQWINTNVAEGLVGAGMLIALPMLLFGANIKQNWRLAGPGLLAYGLCALAGLISTAVAAYLFRETQSDGWQIAGMLTGLYTGGTPNMQAIGMAVDAPSNYVFLLQAADILGGGVFLLMLITIIKPFLLLFLPDFKSPDQQQQLQETDDEILDDSFAQYATAQNESINNTSSPINVRWFIPTLLSIIIVAAAAGLTYLLMNKEIDLTVLILLLTTFSLAASFSPRISKLPGAYRQGEYFLLIFCVALGLMANFKVLINDGLPLLAFSLVALTLTILLHWLFSYFAKTDTDTTMIAATAALYGPVFIAQVTTALKNKRLLAPGIALSLLGLAVGNYLGIAVAYLAQWLMGSG